jgi:glycosyltransferase involved in cell wall biosynthesis
MKIAHIAPPWISIPPANYGGTEIVLYNLIEEQIAQGHQVTLLAPGDAQTSAQQVSFFPQSLSASEVPWSAHLKAYFHFYHAVEYVQTHQFDILHTHLSASADMYLFPLTAHLTTPHVMTLHSRFPFDRVGSWIGDADQYYMKWASSVPMVAISESAREEAPLNLNFVGVVHHGLPMQMFRPTQERPENFFVWLGRIVPEKGPHLAIRAAKKAGVPLVLAGIIDRYVPEAMEYFEHTIKPEIDGEQITYIGPVNQQEKIHLLSRARAFLNPIRWEEPFGMVMIEAMALGCPVITFPSGAAPEIVVHRKSGFFAHDVDEMAHFIDRIDTLNRATVRAHAEQHFSSRVMAEKYTAIYRKVMLNQHLPQPVTSHTPLITPAPLTINDPAQRLVYPPSRAATTEAEAKSVS